MKSALIWIAVYLAIFFVGFLAWRREKHRADAIERRIEAMQRPKP